MNWEIRLLSILMKVPTPRWKRSLKHCPRMKKTVGWFNRPGCSIEWQISKVDIQ